MASCMDVHGLRAWTLFEVFDKWTEAIEQGDSVDAIYHDFIKAFDMVPHQRLLVKLAGYGIGGKVLRWIVAFLEGRRQRVLVNRSKSSWSIVTSGIPQGRLLGTMFFSATLTTCQMWYTHLFTCSLMIPRYSDK